MILKSVVRSRIEYGCTVYGGASQGWLNKVTVAYNKGMRICMRSLKTTSIHALEVETGSTPLKIRRKFLAHKEVLNVYKKGLPMMSRLDLAMGRVDTHGLTYLEVAGLEISDLLGEVCRAKLTKLPDNLKVTETLAGMDFVKADPTARQWKHLADTTIRDEYGLFKQVYTDASKKEDGRVGIGINDGRKVRNFERLSGFFQITNAELVAILKAVIALDNEEYDDMVILTDSLNGCKWIG